MDQPQPQPPPGITFEEIVLWLEQRRKWILSAIVLIGVAGLVLVVRDAGIEGGEHRATAALFNFQAANRTNDVTTSQLQALLPATEGTGILPHVKLREATSLYTAGKHAEALQAYEDFAREFAGSPLLPEASYGAAVCLEAQGKPAEALARYQEVATRFPESSLVSRARLGQARIHEQQGDQQQAYRIYRDLATPSAGSMSQFGQTSPLQVDANLAVRRLIKANPALLQTNAPAASPLIAPTNIPTAAPGSTGS